MTRTCEVLRCPLPRHRLRVHWRFAGLFESVRSLIQRLSELVAWLCADPQLFLSLRMICTLEECALSSHIRGKQSLGGSIGDVGVRSFHICNRRRRWRLAALLWPELQVSVLTADGRPRPYRVLLMLASARRRRAQRFPSRLRFARLSWGRGCLLRAASCRWRCCGSHTPGDHVERPPNDCRIHSGVRDGGDRRCTVRLFLRFAGPACGNGSVPRWLAASVRDEPRGLRRARCSSCLLACPGPAGSVEAWKWGFRWRSEALPLSVGLQFRSLRWTGPVVLHTMASRWCQRRTVRLIRSLPSLPVLAEVVQGFLRSLFHSSKIRNVCSKKSENPRRQCSVLCYPMNTQKETSCLRSQSRSWEIFSMMELRENSYFYRDENNGEKRR